MPFLGQLQQAEKAGKIPAKLSNVLAKFYASYATAASKNGYVEAQYDPLLTTFLDLVLQVLAQPVTFEPYHDAIRAPFDHYQFGLNFLRPLIIFESSKVLGIPTLDTIEQQLAQGDNVILFANHQTEPDPQAISLLLEKNHPKLGERMIFVAGHRVISDPLCIPFSMGCNLLCIFSKKYIETQPELKEEKLLHNQRTLKRMSQLLSEGGKFIYVAPSGGRDRPNAQGIVEVAKFDPKSIEIFSLIAHQAGRPTHFYPLALATYNLLPPPNSIHKEIGERRHAHSTPIHMAFGKEIDMEKFPGSDVKDKRQKRRLRADYIWDLVKQDYAKLMS